MARNEEKANSMLSRFLAAKADEERKPRERRPFLASECRDLAEADGWRAQILREVGKKVMEIQNPGLGEHRLRDLNDDINKLIREKGHWEARILELGGPNYAKSAPRITDAQGNEVDAASGKGPGYRYFGAAKQLPGVRELFDKPPQLSKKRSRYELYKRIDADYYGYRDDEDGVLEKLEKVAEEKAISDAIDEWKAIEAIKAEAKMTVKSGEVVTVKAVQLGEDEDEDEEAAARNVDGPQGREFVAHVPLPDEKEIERMVLAKKKAELLAKYASEDLVAEEQEAKSLLNIHR
eukprot:SM000429S16081  [mRNA]  locus=s429:27139:29075:- [translate_table: standard]